MIHETGFVRHEAKMHAGESVWMKARSSMSLGAAIWWRDPFKPGW